MYKGIDYGCGITNKDIESNIRYGVIHQNEVLQVWCDESEPYYGDMDECECEFCDPVSFRIDDNEYQAESDSYGDIFITKSPYFTYAQFCSPCAPGACYLMDELEERDENNKCYCFGHDWFDDDVAPYKVYDVKTGELVKSE